MHLKTADSAGPLCESHCYTSLPKRVMLLDMLLTYRCRLWVSKAHHIEEGHVVLLNAEVCYLLPLLTGGVDACGVVRTSCTQHNWLSASTPASRQTVA